MAFIFSVIHSFPLGLPLDFLRMFLKMLYKITEWLALDLEVGSASTNCMQIKSIQKKNVTTSLHSVYIA